MFWKRGGWLRTTLMVTVVLVRRALVRWSLACTTHCTHEALVRWTWDFTLTAAVAVQNTIHFQQAMMISLSATLKRTGIVHTGHIDSRIKFCLSDMNCVCLKRTIIYSSHTVPYGTKQCMLFPRTLSLSPLSLSTKYTVKKQKDSNKPSRFVMADRQLHSPHTGWWGWRTKPYAGRWRPCRGRCRSTPDTRTRSAVCRTARPANNVMTILQILQLHNTCTSCKQRNDDTANSTTSQHLHGIAKQHRLNHI